jgi:hypothetical protein
MFGMLVASLSRVPPLHGESGSWDEIALILLAPLVIAAVIWVTRQRGNDSEDEE